MDWVHCNRCYTQPGDTAMKKFFITNCGHVYCDECLDLNQSNECRICHIKYTTIPLTSNMNSDVEIYFHDPLANLKKQVKIFEFQQSHRIRLVSHNREIIRSYNAVKKENYNLREELKVCKKENATLREQIRRMKEGFREFRKKYEPTESNNQRSSQVTPPIHSSRQLMTKAVPNNKPKLSNNIYGGDERLMEGNFNSSLKRSSNSGFFLMSELKPFKKEGFRTTDLPLFPGTYRSNLMSTPDMNSPPTPELITREYSQEDPLIGKVKLSGSRSGPSPSTRIGFHGLTLSRSTSTPIKENTITNKYLKYFS